jgi:transglutaminase-like putative cysteine protease
MRYLIEHETSLSFPKPVREHQFELRLAPREDAGLRRISCDLTVEPAAPLRTHLDCFGNLVHRVTLLAPHESLCARVVAEVETALANPFDYAPIPVANERRWLDQQLRDDPSLLDFVLHRSDAVPDVDEALAALGPPAYDADRALVQNGLALMAWAGATFRYVPGSTEVHGALAGFVEQKAGVCQDFAHLVVAVVRSWGFAARYVMGYADPGSVAPADAAAGQATHAWAELLVPGAGWRGFDATAGLVANDTYVPVAVGRDSRDTPPLRGTFKGDDGGLPPRVAVRVERIEQSQTQYDGRQQQVQVQ